MKDEYNNECPYDFKNIQFNREGTYYYTFSWVDENNTVKDLSIVGNELYNDNGQISGCYGNKIGSVTSYNFGNMVSSPTDLATALNNNVFISTYAYESGTFYGCYSNISGNDCFNNTFGNNCYSNIFGNNCFNNTLGNNCTFNTFGNLCYFNTFGDNCSYNTFGNQCRNNIFGDNCSDNTFGNECNECIFGDRCNVNIVDTGVYQAAPQPTTGTQPMQGVHIHYGVTGPFTVVRGASYTQDVRKSGSQEILLD